MENKNNGGLIAIIIILLVALLGVCGYVAYDKGLIFDKKVETNEEENKELENIVEEENTDSKYVSLEIKDENCINPRNMNYDMRYGSHGLLITVNPDNSVSLTYNLLKDVWYLSNVQNDQLRVDINNFKKKIVEVFVGGIGQDIAGHTAIFLLEDGTLEYIPLYKALYSNDIRSYGKLEGVENIIKLYSVTALPKNSPIGGHSTILAQKADGTYYDLNEILRATGNY